jgi:AraC family transcriptional regulator
MRACSPPGPADASLAPGEDAAPSPQPERPDGLTTIQRGIDYIEDHLDDALTLHDVGRAAGLSAWHFQRSFKALTNETLKAYIRGRRLARAGRSLVGGRERLIELALAAGYDSQESFTRAFKQHCGATPGAYRRAGRQPFVHRKARIDADYLAHLHGGLTLEPAIERLPARTCIGLKTSFFGTSSEKNNMAERLPPLWEAFLARLPEVPGRRAGGPGFGILWQEETADEELLGYCAAVEVDDHGASPVALPPGMTVIRLREQLHARFRHVGAVQQLDHTVNYIYSNWLLRSGWRHAGGPDLEIYGDAYEPGSEASVMHYAVPVDPPL